MNKPSVVAGLSRAAFGVALLLSVSGVHAASIDLDPDVQPNKNFAEPDENKPFVEEQVALPPFPQQKNLIPLDTGPTASYVFALDAKSLTVGKDGVIRYTVVATSPSGAVNIIYEGLRCKTFEYRPYAFGGKNDKWVPARNGRWQVISSMAKDQSHFALAQDYFCEGRTLSGGAEQIIERIRYQRRIEN
ncbi:MAG: CNP1-like family protein [Burkholderiaceae bacterium]|nr:CNP1-like family protein [Burkholderiaceae bacterium]